MKSLIKHWIWIKVQWEFNFTWYRCLLRYLLSNWINLLNCIIDLISGLHSLFQNLFPFFFTFLFQKIINILILSNTYFSCLNLHRTKLGERRIVKTVKWICLNNFYNFIPSFFLADSSFLIIYLQDCFTCWNIDASFFSNSLEGISIINSLNDF